MTRYVVRRLGLFALGLLVTSVVIFAVLRVLPGDVARMIAGLDATPEQIAALRAELGLDRPLVAQYGDWISGIARGDLGESLLTGRPVGQQIAEKMQVTLPLAALALVLSVLWGVPLGIAAALAQGRPLGTVLNVVAQAAAAIPALWAGLLLIVLFGRGIGLVGILPSQGFPLDGWASPGRALAALVLPAVTVAVITGARILRFTRSAVLDVMGQDFVRSAAAAGLTRRQAIVRRGLPDASLAILSVIGLAGADMITGVVIIERLFVLPGLGSMLVTDIGQRDLPKVQGELLVLTALVLVIGLVVDVAHRLIDPRQRVTAS